MEGFVDEGVSGAKPSRTGLDRMLAAVQAGRIDLVALWKLGRLGRSLQRVLGVLDQLTSQWVGFVSVRGTGQYTTTPAELLFTSMIAEFERGLIQERVVARVRWAQAAEKRCGHPRREIDLWLAEALLKERRRFKDVARILKAPRATLRLRLAELGQ